MDRLIIGRHMIENNLTNTLYSILAEVPGLAQEIQYFMLDILENDSLLLVSYELPILGVVKYALIRFPFQVFFVLAF